MLKRNLNISLVILLSAIMMIFLSSCGNNSSDDKSNSSEEKAKVVVEKLLNVTEDDVESFYKAFDSNEDSGQEKKASDDSKLKDYFKKKYDGLMTDKGLDTGLRNRSLGIPIVISGQNKSDIEAKNVKLEKQEGDNYNFSADLYAKKSNKKTASVIGKIKMIKENDDFKVDYIELTGH